MRRYSSHLLPAVVTVIALGVALQRLDGDTLWATVRQLPIWSVAVVLGALIFGTLLASIRVRILAKGLGQQLSYRDAIVATAAGNLAGSFFFQIIGQTAARSAILSKVGISLPTTIILTGYERIIAAVVSLVLAVGGALFLFHHITFDLVGGGINLVLMLCGILAVTLAGWFFTWGSAAGPGLRRAITPQTIRLGFRAATLSLVIQSTTLAAYLVATISLMPDVSLANLFAAIMIVMFAASVPISLAGWGLREVSAIYALGAIGVPNEISLVVTLLIGASSIATIAIIAIIASQFARPAIAGQDTLSIAANETGTDHARFLSRFIPIFAASAVFFQVYVPVSTGQLNVNLADSVILFGGALFLLQAWRGKNSGNRLTMAWIAIALMSAVIVLSFVHGVYDFGFTTWASTNRLFGWLVLLSYAGTGALIASDTDDEGMQILLRTYIAAGLAIVGFDLTLLIVRALGVVPTNILPFRMEGFAQNPNAFGFQLLLVLVAIIAARLSSWRQNLILALTFAGLYFTASRAAEGSALIVCIAAIALRRITLKPLLLALVSAAAICAMIFLLGSAGSLFTGSSTNLMTVYFDVNSQQLSGEGSVSNAERWESLTDGFQMFLAHPLFGAGLGAFVHDFEQEHGRFLIIHSTPLWLLAETGLLGFLVFAGIGAVTFISRIRSLLTHQAWDVSRTFCVLCLLGFGAMSQVHEMLFQRPLWLLLGAAVLAPRLKSRQTTLSSIDPA